MRDDLVRAIDTGDVDEVRRLLAEHPEQARADVAWDGCRSDPLHYLSDAPFHGRGRHDRWGELARAFIAAGAPLEGRADVGETPLIGAASLGRVDVARALVDAGANLEATGFAAPGGTALAHAVQFGFLDVARVLVDAGAHVGLPEAAAFGDLSGHDLAAASHAERALALRTAAVYGQLGVIDELLATGLDVEAQADDGTAHHAAVWEGRAAAVRHLLAAGADPLCRDRRYGGTADDWLRVRRERHGERPGDRDVERLLATRGHAR
jgi:ankyrin repeat protein